MKVQPWQLKQRQGHPLEIKERLTETRIRGWYEHWAGQIYVAFSGGKDSTVLLHQVRRLYPNVPAVFADTGLEYPEIKEFVKSVDNVHWVTPIIPFNQIIKKYGYPIVSKKVAKQIRTLQNPKSNNAASRKLYLTGIKRDGTKSKSFRLAKKWLPLINSGFKVSEKCCDIMKKEPLHKYAKLTKRKALIGTMAEDSNTREQGYLTAGCNSFEGNNVRSLPMAFWLESDVWDYIKKYNLDYCKIYDMGAKRTGCMFCMFGVHLEQKPNRFQRMKTSHPKQYDYCINKLGCGKVMDFIGVDYGSDNQIELISDSNV